LYLRLFCRKWSWLPLNKIKYPGIADDLRPVSEELIEKKLFTTGISMYLHAVIYVICICLHIVLSNTYCVVFLFCFSSSCVHHVASFSGLSIFYCPFDVPYRLFVTMKQCHWNISQNDQVSRGSFINFYR
jgi:hypothetical protein